MKNYARNPMYTHTVGKKFLHFIVQYNDHNSHDLAYIYSIIVYYINSYTKGLAAGNMKVCMRNVVVTASRTKCMLSLMECLSKLYQIDKDKHQLSRAAL